MDPPSPRRKVRADQLLVEQGLAPTRSAGQALILAGRVYVGDRRIDKAGTTLPGSTALSLQGGRRFVSRGGIKLESALAGLGVVTEGLIVADLGASTGGFTDCLLAYGARKVFAIDVGTGLLAEKLRKDLRVVVMEGTNARYLDERSLPEAVDLVTIDASFIGVKLLLPAAHALLRAGGHLLAMVKPQFEVGKAEARRTRGVIRDPSVREAALAEVRTQFIAARFRIRGECDSSLTGPKGNLERFMLAEKVGGGHAAA